MLKPKGTFPAIDLVDFGDVARKRVGMQCQYASRYVSGECPTDDPDGYPDVASDPQFGDELRVEGDAGNYHDIRIHADDVDEFVDRMRLVLKRTRN
ncbi:MAG: hypothetical protein IPM23_01175 [Candidatus Melainabacteria bacterium]|nr:hypothetical protein [Candidatus Melainabacteria bacterium]